ncbi:MAG: hypothetical protein ACOC4K_00400 [Verrucomicrobiota bacterium]
MHTIKIHTRYAQGTYHARQGAGKNKLTCSCTGGEGLAARALIMKWYGGKGIETLRKTGETERGIWDEWQFENR